MPRGATSSDSERSRPQPYGSRSEQSARQNQQSSYPGGSQDAQPSIVQPVDQVAPEASNNDTGEHTDELTHVDWQPIPPTDAAIRKVEPGRFQAHMDHSAEAMLALHNALPPGPKSLIVRVEQDAGASADVPVSSGPSEPPRGPRYPQYDSYRPRELRMVDSMSLQTISRTNSRAPPSMSIFNDSRGERVQDDEFPKVPSASNTISLRVDSEETLLQAYRHVKAMNPSAPVDVTMISVPHKTEKLEFLLTELNNTRGGTLTSRQSQ